MPTAVKDSFIRSFIRSKKGPYIGLKNYVTQAEDRKLEAKLFIVEKYSSRIPELVNLLNKCYESDLKNAGTHKHKKPIKLEMDICFFAL